MALGDDYTTSGRTKLSDAEAREHQESILAKRITEIPNDLQQRFEYNADGTVKYAGYAPRSLAEGTDGWMIHYFEYTAMQVTKRTTAFGNWTNRASENYA